MKRRARKKMFIIIGVLLALTGILTIYFHIPCSKTKVQFDRTAASLAAKEEHLQEVFRKEDLAALPVPVARYFEYCGYIGTPKMTSIKIAYQNVDFFFGKDKPVLKIDYTQYNFMKEPDRIAYIKSSMYGIPFEGLDSFVGGAGSMKGVLAKQFTLFDQRGTVMDRSSLVTFLSEVLLFPSAALRDYIAWEALDSRHAKASITWRGLSAGGIFAFDEKGRLLSFTTDDRTAVTPDGSSESARWSVVLGGYTEAGGIRRPTEFQAIWHYDDGNQVYFDGKGTVTDFY